MKDQLDVTCYFISLVMCSTCFGHKYIHHQELVIQQHSRKLLMMGILMSETCWAHKKWNKIASDIKLVFHSSTKSVYFAHSLFLNSFVTVSQTFSPGDSLCEEGKYIVRRLCKIAKGGCFCEACSCTLNSSASLDGHHEVLYVSIFRKSAEKIQVSLISDRITSTVHENVCAFLMVSRWVLLRKRIF